jgi:hypothetical protein
MGSLSDSISSNKGCSARCNSGLSPSASSRFTFRGLQPRSRSPYDFVNPRAVLIREVRARTSPARARMTVRSACAFRLRGCTGPAGPVRFAPAGPGFGHRSDHPFGGSPRSSAGCAQGPRSLRAPTHSTAGSPTANASRFPVPPDCAASPRRLPSSPSVWSPAFVPEVFLRLHSERSTSSIGLPDPNRSSVSTFNFFHLTCRGGANLLHCRSPYLLRFKSASITWERIASRRRPAFSSHLITTASGCHVRHYEPSARSLSSSPP